MPGDYGEIKIITATIASGAGTASGVFPGGFRYINLFIPTLTSAAISFVGETARSANSAVAQAFAQFRTTAGTLISAAPPGGITAMWLASDNLDFLRGFAGEVRISAAAAQAANRDFVWHLKG